MLVNLHNKKLIFESFEINNYVLSYSHHISPHSIMLEKFRSMLRNTVLNESLNASNWKSNSWKELADNLNQEILNDAFSQMENASIILQPVGTLIPRKCKQMTRITKKINEVGQRGGEYFKVLSDLVAGRIHCDVTEIPTKIDMINNIVNERNGLIYIRGDLPYGFCMKGDQFTDITQYVYVYLDDVHYPIELQIGHEFASHTFTIDSALRDNPNCGLTDLWSGGFYNEVKQYILDKANGKPIAAGRKYDIFEKANDLHKYNVPDDLKIILDKL